MGGTAGTSGNRRSRWASAWIPGLVVLVGWVSVAGLFKIIGIEVTKRELVFELSDIEYAAQLIWAYFLWGVASAVFVTASLVAHTYAFRLLHGNLRRLGLRRPALIVAAAVLLTAVAYVGVLVMQVGTDFKFTDPVMPDLFAKLFDRIEGDRPARLTARVLASLGMVLTIPLVAASVSLLGANEEREGLGELRRKLVRLRMLLYITATALVAGVVEAYGIHMTNIKPNDPQEYIQHLHSLSSAITFGLGGGYSLLLLTVYLPTSFLLRRRIESSLSSEVDAEKRAAKLAEHGLNERWFSGLWRVLAVLSPLLAGLVDIPIGQVLGALAG